MINAICPYCTHVHPIPASLSGKDTVCHKCGGHFIISEHPQRDADAPPKERRLKPHLYRPLKAGIEFGKLAINNGYITMAQLRQALNTLKDELNAGKKTTIEEILVINKLVEPETIAMLRMIKTVSEMGENDKAFGDTAMRMGFAREAEVTDAFRQQIREFAETRQIRSISEILVLKDRMKAWEVQAVRKAMKGDDAPEPPSEDIPETMPSQSKAPPYEEQPLKEELRDLMLDIADDGLTATLTISRDQAGKIKYSQLEMLARDAGIVYGLTDESSFASLRDNPGPVVVARGVEPVPGQAATICHHFETDCLRAGSVSEDGHLDFKSTGETPFAMAGSFLAELVPTVPGTPGITVRGEPLHAPTPDNQTLSAGPGASLSPDGLAVHAETDGSPHAGLDGTVSVLQEYRVEGDVGPRTGDITFPGNVVITGAVQEGFRVKGAHVMAGAVKGGEIMASAGVLVREGIIDSRVSAGGSIRASHIATSRIEAFGDVVISNEIRDSRIRSSGLCVTRQGDIISSEITALKGLLVRNVGTHASRPCLLKMGVDDHVRNVLSGLMVKVSEADKSLTRAMGALKKQEKELLVVQGKAATLASRQEQLMRQMTTLTDGAENQRQNKDILLQGLHRELKALDRQVKGCFEKDDTFSADISLMKQKTVPLRIKLEMYQKQYEAVAAWARAQEKKPEIIASGDLKEGTTLVAPHSKRVLSETLHHVRLKEQLREDGKYSIE